MTTDEPHLGQRQTQLGNRSCTAYVVNAEDLVKAILQCENADDPGLH